MQLAAPSNIQYSKKTRKSQRTEVKRTIGKELGGNHPFKSLFLQIILFKLQKEARDAGPAHSLCSVHLSSSAHPGCRRALLCILRQKCWNKWGIHGVFAVHRLDLLQRRPREGSGRFTLWRNCCCSNPPWQIAGYCCEVTWTDSLQNSKPQSDLFYVW